MRSQEFLKKHGKILVPVISTVISILIFVMALYVPEAIILVFAIPVIIFILMHYSGIYRFKPRFFGGLIVLIIMLLVVAGIYSTDFYHSSGVTTTSENQTYMETIISPFTQTSGYYNITVKTNYTGNINSSYINIVSSNYNKIYNYSSGEHETIGSYRLTYYHIKLPPGLYTVYFNISKKLYMESIGPVNVSAFTLYVYYIYAMADKYIIFLGILYIAGISIAYFMQKGNLNNNQLKK
ncbi:hypothetical protein [Acidiplasma sp.]|uniref:hypothetical protein n=1 Tax=Acidiplasma sp. TaxID=1872114 RepID=UPI002587C40F|nr:hypothetical protein [Acidiplasma sp.]